VSKRWLIAIPALAALGCAAIMFYLIIQIDQTRKQLQEDGVQEFNFILQIDHNYDTLAQSIVDYLAAVDTPGKAVRQDNYILRYDILYSSIRMVSNAWLGHLSELETAQTLLTDSNRFLDEYEPLMRPEITANPDELYRMKTQARSLAHRVYEIGLNMFEHKSIVRDNISRRMDDLYDAFWIFTLSFLLATLLTIAFLYTLSRRAESLTADARQTRSKLSTALDELTTGDIERRAQNRFMAAASHDLRQPLHALGLYLSALKSHVSSEKGLSILANVNRSTEALNQLLNSMLDLSKLDAGVVDVSYEQLDLDALFEHLHRTFQPDAQQRALQLDIQFSGLYVYSDRVLLERILGNLVGNALTYTLEGTITVSARVADSQAIISVSDTGPGIPLQEQEAIFNEYYQLQNPERDRTKGLGLGLSIVKRLTRLLNIDLNITSDTGRGTEFELQLRLSDPVSETALPCNALNAVETGKDPAISPINLSGLSILVIDDEHDVRDGTATLLKQQDGDVVMADSPEQACQHIVNNEWIPDLIIADYRLRGEMTGDTAIEMVREEVNMDVPAMIITGDTSPERLREATASGFPLLHKPVVADDLIAAIVAMRGARQ